MPCRNLRETEAEGQYYEFCKLQPLISICCCGEKEHCEWPDDFEATDSEVS